MGTSGAICINGGKKKCEKKTKKTFTLVYHISSWSVLSRFCSDRPLAGRVVQRRIKETAFLILLNISSLKLCFLMDAWQLCYGQCDDSLQAFLGYTFPNLSETIVTKSQLPQKVWLRFYCCCQEERRNKIIKILQDLKR